jgi:hypothetical protein
MQWKKSLKIINFLERGEIDTDITQIHDHLLFILGSDTLIKRGGAKQVLWALVSPLSEMMWSFIFRIASLVSSNFSSIACKSYETILA